MLKQLPKLILLVALLSALVISSAPTLARGKVCSCLSSKCVFEGKGGCPTGGCTFDKKTSQCVNTGCSGICF